VKLYTDVFTNQTNKIGKCNLDPFDVLLIFYKKTY